MALPWPACLILLLLLASAPAVAQDSPETPAASTLYDKAFNFPDKVFGAVNRKSEKLQQQLERSTQKYLRSLEKQERRLHKKLMKKDSAAAEAIFGDVSGRYASLRTTLNDPTQQFSNVYSGRLDSMTTALKFVQGNGKVQAALKDYGKIQSSFNQTQFVQQQLKERQQQLQERLKNFGMVKEFRQFQEKVYYYRAQVDEYKNIFEQPRKLEATVLQAIKKIPAFKNFFAKHSQLGQLFRLPGSEGETAAAIPGLQTRNMVMQDLDQRLGSGPNANQFMSSSIANAQNGLNEAKKKLQQLGNSGGDMDMPNFKPNNEKSKSFLKRLELGTNVQSTKSNSFFPVTTDFGLSVGYKLSPKAVAGVGASYKMGWGRDIKHISISHEGVGIRTFADIKLKGSIWITGGGEMNFRSRINDFAQLNNRSDWQQSVLAGVTKKYKISNKMKGTMQILFDFLHKRNFPATQPVVFRMGYSL